LAAAGAFALGVQAQGPPFGGPPPGPPPTGKAAALYDVTGYWIAVVSEDWRYRMITPQKGDYTGILLNPEGRKLADAWDPAKDEAAGEQCKSYGAPTLLRVPGRIHIAWQDDQTLKLDSDAGQQTRLLHFSTPAAAGSSWQGVSKAAWEIVPVGRGVPSVGSLKIVTTGLKPGYLRKNGVPYSASTVLTEYFDLASEPNGDSYLMITTTVEDPVYLSRPFLTSSHYRKLPDNRGWKPVPCSVR